MSQTRISRKIYIPIEAKYSNVIHIYTARRDIPQNIVNLCLHPINSPQNTLTFNTFSLALSYQRISSLYLNPSRARETSSAPKVRWV